jgi:hypothetical protein
VEVLVWFAKREKNQQENLLRDGKNPDLKRKELNKEQEGCGV